MATYLLKKSYQLKNLKEVSYKDLWGDHGVFTTMWIYGKPQKILFFYSLSKYSKFIFQFSCPKSLKKFFEVSLEKFS